jgi:hypothetical protein
MIKDLKKRISLLLASAMLFGLLAPFALPPITVMANIPQPQDPPATGLLRDGLGNAHDDGVLKASFNAMLTPNAIRPNFHAGTWISPPGSAMLNWEIPAPGVGAPFMDVLRFFDYEGNRHELSVRQITAHDGPGLMVDYDIYVPRRLNPNAPVSPANPVVGYVHISDPVRRIQGGAPGNFRIYVPVTGIWETPRNFFIRDNRNEDVIDDGLNTYLNRVNDRPRFVPAIGTDFTPVRDDYFMTVPRTNHNSRSLIIIPNPAYDPLDPSLEPEFIEAAVPVFSVEHYDWLSPSFNIGDGRGYSFEFGAGRKIHFRWENGQFFLFLEDFTRPGNVHDFTLERYSGVANINNYKTNASTAAPATPAGNMMVSDLTNAAAPTPPTTTVIRHLIGTRDTHVMYILSEIDKRTLNAIPYAESLTAGVPNTRGGRLTGYDSNNNLVNPPLYCTLALDMTARNPAITPAKDDLGLDIRFNLPGFFNEATGQFDGYLLDNPLGQQLGVFLSASVAAGTTPEDFELFFPLMETAAVPASGANYDFDLDNCVFAAIDNVTGRTEMDVRAVSLLQREGQPSPDRVRMQVGGLSSSIAYENVTLSLSPMQRPGTTAIAANFLTGGGVVGTPDEPFYTFLDFKFDIYLGRPTVIVEPFNYKVARIPGYTVRLGFYQLVSDLPPPGGFAPSRLETPIIEKIYFAVPEFVAGRNFYITHSQISPIVGDPPRLFSQNVTWRPHREPVIDMPDTFTVSEVLNRPMRGEEHLAHLSYRLQWNIGTARDVAALLGSPDERFGSKDDTLWLQYTIGHSTAPEVQSMATGADSTHREYMKVDIEIRRGPDDLTVSPPAATFEMRIRNTSDFITPARDPRTPLPIVSPNLDEWVPLAYRPDPSRGESVYFVSMDVETNSVRRYSSPPPPPYIRNDFQFPGIYYMNIRLQDWGVLGQPPVDRNEGGPWTLFDYIVIDDLGRLDPPPPASLTVSAGPTWPVTTQPFLNVSYNIPTGAARAYLNTHYPMQTQISANIYIGRFEKAIMDTFFSAGSPLPPNERSLNAIAKQIPFEDLFVERADGEPFTGRTELDMSDPEIQRILRGEVDILDNEPASGVIRITGIPLIQNSITQVSGASIGLEDVVFMPGDIVNDRLNDDITSAQSFAGTQDILNRAVDFPIHLRLTGMDENTAYFIFSDMQIEKWVDNLGWAADNSLPRWLLRADIPPNSPNPAISDLTGVVSETTVGSPQDPPPGEQYPPAPENAGVRDVEQMAASVYWDPFVLTPAEEEEGYVKIEWEIIRIKDGVRMTLPQLNARNPILKEVLDGLTYSPNREGWITDGRSLTHVTVNPDGTNEIPDATDEDGDEFIWYPNEVELRDKTLEPNNLYFYYVRTVRIEESFDAQLQDYVMIRNVSTWVEVTVTTYPIQPPQNLRLEDGSQRPGFNGQTMALVSWAHPQMAQILEEMGEKFLFEYQIREMDGVWRDFVRISPDLMTASRLDPPNSSSNRIQYLLEGLEHSSFYEMRVRLIEMTTGDASLWSNTITIATDIDQDGMDKEREVDDWLGYMRRRLEEILRQPYWTAQRTATSSILVYRPAEVFNGHMLSAAGSTAIPLHNNGTNRMVYYLPTSALLTANENRRGFVTAFPDMEFLFAPSFLNDASNQAVMDMIRAIDARGSEISDSYVRITFDRHALGQINDVPAITPSTSLTVEMVGTNDTIRNIRSWDNTMSLRARRIIENWLGDPILRQGIRDLLNDDYQNEDISDHIYHLINRVEAEIIRDTGDFMTTSATTSNTSTATTGDTRIRGILSHERRTVTEFNAQVNVTATEVTENMSASGYRRVNNNWQIQNLTEYHNGRGFGIRAPGAFAFTGRVIDIPDIENVPRGNVAVGIVARYGLEDLFGLNIDLQQNATRQMIVGSIARAAGVPRNSDAFAWANANLNVTMPSRNAAGLIPWQEAVAVTMALYERRTNTAVNTMNITNFQQTAGMNLDARYARAVRAAFEVGIVSNSSRDPAGAITIGEFLDMLTLLSSRVRV